MERSLEKSFELAYEAGLRSLAQQEASLDSIRTRAGTLIAAISISTSFLGDTALRDPGFGCLEVAATVLFVTSIVCCLVVLVPRKEKWVFRMDPATLVKRIKQSGPSVRIAGWHEAMSVEISTALESNDKKIDRLATMFKVAAGSLTAEIVFWIIDIAGG